MTSLRLASQPVKRRLDPVLAHPGPAVGEPEQRIGIAAVGDEAEPFGVGHRPVGKAVGMEQHLVARPLAVEGETGAVVADLGEAAVMDRPDMAVRNPRRRPAPGLLPRAPGASGFSAKVAFRSISINS